MAAATSVAVGADGEDAAGESAAAAASWTKQDCLEATFAEVHAAGLARPTDFRDLVRLNARAECCQGEAVLATAAYGWLSFLRFPYTLAERVGVMTVWPSWSYIM